MNPIRTHFRPYQPSIEYSNQEHVEYNEVSPDERLKDYIYCYWRLKTSQPLNESFKYRVVSDGCIDILFEQSKPEDIYITGFSAKYVEYDISTEFDYVGIRFLPAGFSCFYDISAKTLTNQFLPLTEVIASLNDDLKKAISSKLSLSNASMTFDQVFTTALDQKEESPKIDKRVLEAMKQILEARGHLSITDLDVGVSERQLRRLFDYYFGDSAKAFAKIIRFQNILGAKPSSESLKKNKIFYNEGYYDQAHFIKEFKDFYGVTPSRAFGK